VACQSISIATILSSEYDMPSWPIASTPQAIALGDEIVGLRYKDITELQHVGEGKVRDVVALLKRSASRCRPYRRCRR
jgi:hypothetical protein